MQLHTPEKFAELARAGRADGQAVETFARAVPGADDGSRKIAFILSDGTVDRMGDTIDPKGWELENFKRNNVALWSHKSDEPPLGRVVNIRVAGKQLLGDVEFADAETYPFADTIFKLLKGKFLNACSVGFIPLKWTFAQDKDRPYGINYIEQELIELSLCSIPANSNALAQARAKGIIGAGDAARFSLTPRRDAAEAALRKHKREAGRR